MVTIILRFISLLVKQPVWLLLLFFGITGLQAQSGPALQVDANIQEADCAGNGHVISVKAIGGQAPYTYSWRDGAEGSFRKDLASGTYSCTVRDAEGAVATKQFNFRPQPAALEVSYKLEAVGERYRVALEVKGGKAPYQYFWMGSGINTEAARASSRQDSLSAGIYQVVVRDANECATSITVNVQ